MPDAQPAAQPPTLRGRGVTLRPIRSEDAEPLYQACQDPAVIEFTTIPHPYTRQMAEAWVAEPPANLWVITDDVDENPGSFCGQIDLRYESESEMALGYLMAPWARGRGLMTSAVELVTEWAFEQGAERVLLCTYLDNTASQRVAEKAGFTFEETRPEAQLQRDVPKDMHVFVRTNPGQ